MAATLSGSILQVILTDDKLIGWLAALTVILILGLTGRMTQYSLATAIVGTSGLFGGSSIVRNAMTIKAINKAANQTP